MDRRDERIKRHVVGRLRSDPEVRGATIIVGVRRRHVTLRGSVPDALARLAARADAWRVRAVKGVTDSLVVRRATRSAADADQRLEVALEQGLGAHPTLAGCRLDIAVTNGVVLLGGTVAMAGDRELAEELCARQPGVVAVANGLGVGELSPFSTSFPDPTSHAA